MDTETEVGVEVLRMVRGNRRAWALLPQLSDRILAWAERFGQQEGGELARQFEAAFVLGSPQHAAWVAVDEGRVCGHLLVAEVLYDGQKVGMVIQLALDAFCVPSALQQTAQFEMEQWARGQGCGRILMVTKRKELGAWERLYGFTLSRYVLEKRLEDPNG